MQNRHWRAGNRGGQYARWRVPSHPLHDTPHHQVQPTSGDDTPPQKGNHNSRQARPFRLTWPSPAGTNSNNTTTTRSTFVGLRRPMRCSRSWSQQWWTLTQTPPGPYIPKIRAGPSMAPTPHHTKATLWSLAPQQTYGASGLCPMVSAQQMSKSGTTMMSSCKC